MASYISIALPYIIIGGFFIALQIAFLIYFRGRVGGVSVKIAS